MMNKKNKDNQEKISIRFLAVSKYTTESNQTGDWRVFMPCLSGKIAPCTNACPIGQNIPELISLVKQSKFREAWEMLVEKNPLPSIAGVCQGFCQEECNRREFDEFVAFNKIEKFLSEMAIKKGWQIPVAENQITGKNVAIIGSGPTGLACACQLARQGCWAAIFESLSVFGGLMKTAIPADRLPRGILDAEINRILAMDKVCATKNWAIDKRRFAMLEKNFDVIFVAVGQHKPIKLGIENEDAKGVVYGLDFLRRFNLGESLDVGRRVTIVGSGNTAVDCAHCAAELGKEVFVFCEKSRNEIPDFLQKGIEAAEKQGVWFFFEFNADRIDCPMGKIKLARFVKSRESCPDNECAQSIYQSGMTHIDQYTDTLIVALGEESDTDFMPKDFASHIEGIFIGGNPKNVASAINEGNRAAKKIMDYLLGRKISLKTKKSPEVLEFEHLNIAYIEKSARNKKISDAKTAINEAERCLNCGTCIGCGVCEQVCPDGSVKIPEDKPPEFNKDYCKGCGICAQVCPRGVIKMEKEEARLR